MENLLKQFEESVIKLKTKYKADEFLVARLRLISIYTGTTAIIIGGFSLALYKILISNFRDSLQGSVLGIDHRMAVLIMEQTRDILKNRIIALDILILFFVIIVSFLLTYETLQPIKENMRRQKRFIADASHELRTPVAVVISGLEVALRNKNLDLQTAQKTLEETLSEMKILSELSNDLLLVSKQDVINKNKYLPIDVQKILNDVVEKMQFLAKEKNIQIVSDLHIKFDEVKMQKIIGNSSEISRVFYNILNNAIFYSNENGIIKINDEILRNNYIVRIVDNGKGIDEVSLGKIFEPFFQADASRNSSGAGLGLTISQKIMKNHKGKIEIKSELGKNTEVSIIFPLIKI